MTKPDETASETSPSAPFTPTGDRREPSWVDEVLRGEAGRSPDLREGGDLRLPEADPWRLRAPPAATENAPGPAPIWPEDRPATPLSLGRHDVAQRRVIAGLLGILLGGLGVHKFYLGLNTPGALMLGVSVGVWIVALFLGLITLGLGLLLTLPLAALIAGAVAVVGLIEGVLYLTKSDEAFYREYVLGRRPWF